MDTTPPSETPTVAAELARTLPVEPELAAFLATVRDGYRQPLPSEVTSQHLRMILAEAAVAPAKPALRERSARWARRVAAVGAVKIALTATAAAAATGTGLAATGALPDAAQTAVAQVAERVGITLPMPTSETPGDRVDETGDPMPGIGEGGVPTLVERDDVDPADLPGEAGDAPGHDRGPDARPETPAADRGAGDERRADVEQGNAGGAERGTDRAEDRPAPPEKARDGDTPAADRPAEAPATKPVAPAREASASEAPASEAPANAGSDQDTADSGPDAGPPAERPAPARETGRG